MIPPRLEPIFFLLVLSGLMSFVISCVSTIRTVGLNDDFAMVWLGAWLPSWTIAFPVALIVAPVARRLVHRFVRT